MKVFEFTVAFNVLSNLIIPNFSVPVELIAIPTMKHIPPRTVALDLAQP